MRHVLIFFVCRLVICIHTVFRSPLRNLELKSSKMHHGIWRHQNSFYFSRLLFDFCWFILICVYLFHRFEVFNSIIITASFLFTIDTYEVLEEKSVSFWVSFLLSRLGFHCVWRFILESRIVDCDKYVIKKRLNNVSRQ